MNNVKSIKLISGCEISGEMANNSVTHSEWLAEGKSLFGPDFRQWKFVCPMCGHIATIQDFLDNGSDIGNAYQECLGRHTGKGSPIEGNSDGCNWTAYGLFGTQGKGRIVLNEDGIGIEVFQFSK